MLHQLIVEHIIDAPEIGDVAARIAQLLFRKRPTLPISELRGFIDGAFDHPAHQILVRDRIAEPAGHGGNLRVEDRRGHLAHDPDENFKILTGGVEDLHARRIGDQPEQRGKVEILRQGIDQNIEIRIRRLDETEFGPVGGFAMEFSV